MFKSYESVIVGNVCVERLDVTSKDETIVTVERVISECGNGVCGVFDE